jgi:hypothetical protein
MSSPPNSKHLQTAHYQGIVRENETMSDVAQCRNEAHKELSRLIRPSSAYNIFFRQERLHILQQAHLSSDEKTPKISQEKIGFAELSRTIAARWKQATPEVRQKFDELADAEKERNHVVVLEWEQLKMNKKNPQEVFTSEKPRPKPDQLTNAEDSKFLEDIRKAIAQNTKLLVAMRSAVCCNTRILKFAEWRGFRTKGQRFLSTNEIHCKGGKLQASRELLGPPRASSRYGVSPNVFDDAYSFPQRNLSSAPLNHQPVTFSSLPSECLGPNTMTSYNEPYPGSHAACFEPVYRDYVNNTCFPQRPLCLPSRSQQNTPTTNHTKRGSDA